jgi:hypothetical protein
MLPSKKKYLGHRRDQNKVSIPDHPELPEDIAADESLLFNANLHAEQAQQQRNLATDRQQQAMEESNKLSAKRSFVVLCVSSSLFFSLY